jgi:hypothetical protein
MEGIKEGGKTIGAGIKEFFTDTDRYAFQQCAARI